MKLTFVFFSLSIPISHVIVGRSENSLGVTFSVNFRSSLSNSIILAWLCYCQVFGKIILYPSIWRLFIIPWVVIGFSLLILDAGPCSPASTKHRRFDFFDFWYISEPWYQITIYTKTYKYSTSAYRPITIVQIVVQGLDQKKINFLSRIFSQNK